MNEIGWSQTNKMFEIRKRKELHIDNEDIACGEVKANLLHSFANKKRMSAKFLFTIQKQKGQTNCLFHKTLLYLIKQILYLMKQILYLIKQILYLIKGNKKVPETSVMAASATAPCTCIHSIHTTKKYDFCEECNTCRKIN